MNRLISLITLPGLVLILLLALPPAHMLAASSASLTSPLAHSGISKNQKHWQVIPSPNVGTTGSDLLAVSSVSAGDIWSVGVFYTPQFIPQTLVEHWNGTSWQVVASPNNGQEENQLNGVAAVSSTNVWAVGYSRNGVLRTLIEHWDGAQWSIIPSPNAGNSDNQLEGIWSLSQNDIWAVGTYFDISKNSNLTLVEHWNGSQWKLVSSPNTGESINVLTAVAAVSKNNIWAVGYGETPGYITLVEHWDGAQWSIIASPNPSNSNSSLEGLTVLAANNIWAAGFYYDNNLNRDKTLIEHWDGTQWSIIPSPNAGTDFCQLYGVAAISARNIWAVGVDTHVPPVFTLTEHWNGTKWSIVKSPNISKTYNGLSAVIAISGTLWAVGEYFNTSQYAYDTLIEYYG
ncbi:MAG TPA: hypothetical protein VKV20_16385 [Ktedonobacteraceae bacterium]|jgi:hypothetical protein|nr:hypothetical protein [Ktedonobacteraceae bacterium]